jgi:hypothetical protein
MIASWFIYFFGVSSTISHGFSRILLDVLQGTTTTYQSESYFIEKDFFNLTLLKKFAFNADSLAIYNYRLIPLGISILVFGALWFLQLRRTLLFQKFDKSTLRTVISTFFFALVAIFSFIVLKGLFLEVPRLFDVFVVFASISIAGWFTRTEHLKRTEFLKAMSLILLVIITSTLGIAVHSSEFVYYPQERDAILFVSRGFDHPVLYTDERLLAFAGYFAPSISVREIPAALSDMLPNQTFPTVLLLISNHSLAYNSYRAVFVDPPHDILSFVESNGAIVYSNQGVNVYYLRSPFCHEGQQAKISSNSIDIDITHKSDWAY